VRKGTSARPGIGGDGARPNEAPGRGDNPHAQPGEALDRIIGRDRGNDTRHMIHHRGKIHRRRHDGEAESGAVPRRLRPLRRGQQRLRRDATIIEAVAAHLGALDQHGLHPELRRARGDGEPARPGADDADIGGDALAHGGACLFRAECHL
jgi:hypothetical protein